MQPNRDGGPAFPAVIPLKGKDYPNFTEAGMSLRDYFAAAALPIDVQDKHPWDDWVKIVAKTTYEVADAMITAREQ